MASNEPSEILDGLIHIYECDEQKVSGVIAPKDGIYRENLSVYVKDGNTELASGTTNSNGIFNISFFLPVGQYDPIIKCGNNTKSIYESGLRSLACSLTLTSDKDILSAADNDFATLSATLKCTETNEFLSNRNITFEITKDDTVIQTLIGQTNSSGVATVTYESQGLGDISVTARIGSIVSETYSIEDCYKFDSLTSNKNLFSVTSGSATINYSNDGVTITGNTSTETHIVADFTLPTSDYMITYDVNAITTASDGYTLHSCFEDLLLGHNRNGFYARKVSVSGDIWGGGGSYNPPCTMKLEVNGTTTKTIAVYRNNSQIKTTLTGINKTGVMQFISYANGRGLTLKNLKIKPL